MSLLRGICLAFMGLSGGVLLVIWGYFEYGAYNVRRAVKRGRTYSIHQQLAHDAFFRTVADHAYQWLLHLLSFTMARYAMIFVENIS